MVLFMKLKFVIKAFIALSLGAVFASEPIVDIPPEQRVLSAEALSTAYRDFLDYHSAHTGRFEPGIQPSVLFAEELKERYESALTLQILGLEVRDPSTLSAHETSIIHDIIGGTFYVELLRVLDDPSTQPWLRDMIYAVYSSHPELFDAARLASNDDLATKQAG